MTTIQKFLAGIVAIGMITAATLPDRQTAKIITAGGGALKGVLGTVISGKG